MGLVALPEIGINVSHMKH